jgi:hypothetical protein
MSGREPGIQPVALYVNGETASSTATVGVSINWFEE